MASRPDRRSSASRRLRAGALLVCAGLVFLSCREYRASRLIDKGRYREALEQLRASTYKHPFLRAKALEGLGRHEQAYRFAMEAVEKERRKAGGPQEPFLVAARLADRLGHGHEVIELLAAARKRGELPDWARQAEARRRMGRGGHLLKMGAPRTALADLKRAETIAKKLGGVASMVGAGRKGAEGFSSLLGRAHAAVGAFHLTRGDLEEARKRFDLASDRFPEKKEQWWRGALTLLEGGDVPPADAFRAVEALMALGAPNAAAKVSLAAASRLSRAQCGGERAVLCLRLLGAGLDAAGLLWERDGARELQRVIARLAGPEPGWAELAAEECERWAEPSSPACVFVRTRAARKLRALRLWLDLCERWAIGWSDPRWLSQVISLVEPDSIGLARRVASRIAGPRATGGAGFSPELLGALSRSPLVKAEVLRLSGRRRRSLAVLREAAGRKTGEPKWMMALAEGALRLGDVSTALAHLRSARASIGPVAGETRRLVRLEGLAKRLQDGFSGLIELAASRGAKVLGEAGSRAERKEKLLRLVERVVGLGAWPAGLAMLGRVRETLGGQADGGAPGAEQGEQVVEGLAIVSELEKELIGRLGAWRSRLASSGDSPSPQTPVAALNGVWRFWAGLLAGKGSEKAKAGSLPGWKETAKRRGGGSGDSTETVDRLGPPLVGGVAADIFGAACITTSSSKRKETLADAPKEALMVAARRWRRTAGCRVGSLSPLLWLSRLRWTVSQAEATSNESAETSAAGPADVLVGAVRTGPEGFGLCRTAGTLRRLLDDGHAGEAARLAFELSETFARDDAILEPAVAALIRAERWGWAELAGHDLVAASRNPARAYRLLAEWYLEASRCDRAGRAAISMLQWVDPALPQHVPALRLTVRVLARCSAWKRLDEQTKLWLSGCETRSCVHGFHRTVGRVLLEEGRYGRAIAHLQTFPELRFEAYLRSGRAKEAFEIAQKLAEAEPLEAQSYCRLARAAMVRRIPGLARELLDRGFLVEPSHPCTFRLRVPLSMASAKEGRAKGADARWADAEAWLQWNVLALEADRADAVFALAALYMKRGDAAQAFATVARHPGEAEPGPALDWLWTKSRECLLKQPEK